PSSPTRRSSDLTVTEAIRRQYLAAGLVEADRVVALPGGVDAEAWQPGRSPRPLRAALGVADGVPVVGLLGGFRVMKGHPAALEAAARLVRAGRSFHVARVGSGSMALTIRALRARLGLTHRVT